MMVGSVQTISHKETGLYLNAWWSDRCTILVEDVVPVSLILDKCTQKV